MNLSQFDQLSSTMDSAMSGVVSAIASFDINNISSQVSCRYM